MDADRGKRSTRRPPFARAPSLSLPILYYSATGGSILA